MGIQQILFMVVVALGFVGYWWWTTGRHGKNAHKVHIGLLPDEVPLHSFAGFFHIERGVKDVLLATVAVERQAQAFFLTRTDAGVTVLKPHQGETMRFSAGDFHLVLVSTDRGKLTGASGSAELADVYQINSSSLSESLKVLLPRSTAGTLGAAVVASAA